MMFYQKSLQQKKRKYFTRLSAWLPGCTRLIWRRDMFESRETIQLISRRSDDEAINLDRRGAISFGWFLRTTTNSRRAIKRTIIVLAAGKHWLCRWRRENNWTEKVGSCLQWREDMFSFLAVQDSSIGDVVSQWVSESFERLLRDFWETFERILRDFWETF